MRHQQKSLLQISQSDESATKGAQVQMGKGGGGKVRKEQYREEGGWEMSSASPSPGAQDTPRSPLSLNTVAFHPGLLQASPVAQW